MAEGAEQCSECELHREDERRKEQMRQRKTEIKRGRERKRVSAQGGSARKM